MTETRQTVISLLRSALSGAPAELPEQPDWDRVLELGTAHKLIPLLNYGVETVREQVPESVRTTLFHRTLKEVFLSENQLLEIERLKNAFEAQGIDFVLLKGALLKRLYPSHELRPMSDVDVLIRVRQYPAIRQVMESLGYAETLESNHELIWDKDFYHIELHKMLIPSYNRDFYAYYGDGWDFVKPLPGKTEYGFSDEDQFLYLFTHFAKHYRDAGIGVLHLVDLRVYLTKHPDMEMQYVRQELKKLRLDRFFENILQVLEVWFGEAPWEDKTEYITGVIFSSELYGLEEWRILSEAVKTSKERKNMAQTRRLLAFRAVFPTYGDMCMRDPWLRKLPFLLPAAWVSRWISTLLFGRKGIRQRRERLSYASEENITSYQNSLQYVGLDYHFDGARHGSRGQGEEF